MMAPLTGLDRGDLGARGPPDPRNAPTWSGWWLVRWCAGDRGGERLADQKVLSRFERRRMPHNLALMAAMEGFERLFQADALPVRWLRNAGLKTVDQSAEVKAMFVRQALGLTGDLPELAKI